MTSGCGGEPCGRLVPAHALAPTSPLASRDAPPWCAGGAGERGLRYGTARAVTQCGLEAIRDHAAKPRLLGAFSDVSIPIDHLQIRQPPEVEQ
jgi:hypothetical protein